MTNKSIALASINREAAVALIDAALAAAREIGIPAAVAVVDATAICAPSNAPTTRRSGFCPRQRRAYALVTVVSERRSKPGPWPC